MANSLREQAFFGGYQTRAYPATALDQPWGDPAVRHFDVAPAVGAVVSIVMPAVSLVRPGIPFTVRNTGGGTVSLVQPGSGVVLTYPGMAVGGQVISPGEGVKVVLGAAWQIVRWRTMQTGTAQPSLIYDVVIRENKSAFNLLQKVIQQEGYDGTQSAFVRVRTTSGVLVGAPNNTTPAFTTGNTVGAVSWAAGSKVILTIAESSKIGGFGGAGGRGAPVGTAIAGFQDASNGGVALRCEINTDLYVGGELFGGGGGGGGGGGSTLLGATVSNVGGGGGGGQGINISANSAIAEPSLGGTATAPAQNGGNGGSGSNANGGEGAGAGGNGGSGGPRGGNGFAGQAGNGIVGAAGAAGAAISRAATATVTTVTGGGNIYGTTIVV